MSEPEMDTGKTRRRIENALRHRGDDEELLRGFAETLGVEVEMVSEPLCHHRCDDECSRPDFGPNQVRHACQLVEGREYTHWHGSRNSFGSFVVLREPYVKNDSLGIDVRVTWPSGTTTEQHYSLADASVVPYETGMWNDSNHFEFSEDRESCHCSHNCSCETHSGKDVTCCP